MISRFLRFIGSSGLLGVAALAFALCRVEAAPRELRVGYFPNITHAHGLIGSHGTQTGTGWFEERLGRDVVIRWFPFNAGPSAMEALLAGSIDLTYVGPNPALNAYVRSRGSEIRVLAGAVEGGSALVVPAKSDLQQAADFRGRRLATPQLGNTQDVAARVWLRRAGLRVTLTGGDVAVIPTANPEQLTLFASGQVAGVWTVEPWVSRLELEAGGRVLVEQSDAVTTLLVARAALLTQDAALVARFVAAHRDLTRWMRENPAAAQEKVRGALTAEFRREISAELVRRAWGRLRFTDEVPRSRLEALVADAQSVGFLRGAVSLDQLFPRP